MRNLTEDRALPLREQEALRVMLEQVGVGAVQLSLGGRALAVNQALCDLLGCSRDTLLSKSLPEIVGSENVQSELAECRRLLSGEVQSFSTERPQVCADGRSLWLKATITLLRDEGSGEPAGYLAIIADLTPYKAELDRILLDEAASEAAIRNQAQFDELMTAILTRFTTCAAREVDSTVTTALRETAEFLGVDHAYVLIFSPDRTTWSATHEWNAAHVPAQGGNYRDVPVGTVPWSETKVLAGEVVRINAPHEYPPEAEAERRLPEMQAGQQSAVLIPMHGAAGIITGAVGFDSHARRVTWSDDDVTRCTMVGDAIATVLERKRAEHALQRSEEKFSKAFEASPAILTIVRIQDRRYVEVNRAFEQHTGFLRTEVLRQTTEELGQKADLQSLNHAIETAVEQGSVRNTEARIHNKGGEALVVLLSAEMVEFDGQRCVLTVAEDITERKQAEEARTELSRRLMTAQEAERARIARELHDSIGQSLALLNIQMQRAAQPASSLTGKKVLTMPELCGKVKEIGNQISRLSHRLHSSELEFLGLAVAVRSLCREFSEQYRIKVDCTCTDLPEDLDNDFALAFLRVVQEALHNIAKHSRASKVRVEVVGTKRDLSACIQDNGTGFEVNKTRMTSGLGMVSMRERMHLIGGEFTISSKPGGGTRIHAKAPLAANVRIR